MTVKGAKLTLTADVDGDGNDETGTFDFTQGTGADVEIFSRTGKLLSQGGGTVISAYNALFESGDSERESLFVDLGGGSFGCRVNLNSFTGSSQTWGNGTSNAAADATGEEPFRQMSVLFRYLVIGEYDSRGNAQLEVGDWSSSGEYSQWDAVAFEEPSVSFSFEDSPQIFQGSLTMFNARKVDLAGASSEQND